MHLKIFLKIWTRFNFYEQKTKDLNRIVELLERLQKTSDIPPQKLITLQRVLQSDFFNSIREVYEHVYDTVDINDDPELRANATAKVIF